MFIICDEKGMVQDKSSSEANLSRGYTYPNYVLYEVDKKIDIRIGDNYDGKTLTINVKLRSQKALRAIKIGLIDIGIKKDKALELRFSDIETEFELERTTLTTEKARLEGIIAIQP